MSNVFIAYQPLFDLFLLHTGYALSQYVALRSGVFSVATPAFAAVGAYGAAILAMRAGVPTGLALAVAAAAGALAGALLSVPLARLRGVYQAIATLAFVQIVLSLNLYAEPLTGGAMGLNGIPRTVGTPAILLALLAVLYLVFSIDRTRIGRAFEAVRQDETMAASLGVPARRFQALAFAISGGVAGLFGGLEAFHGYALEPNQFGFPLLVTVLSYVVFGGRRSIWGPVAGTALLVALPELARPLADNRVLVYGLLLMAVINFLPRGVVDTALSAVRSRRLATQDAVFSRERAP